MQCCHWGQKYGDLCPVQCQSCVWISHLPVDSLFGRMIVINIINVIVAEQTQVLFGCVFYISIHRWRETAEGHWTGVMGGRVWTLTQTEDTLWYHVYKNQERQREESNKMKRTAVSNQVENKTEKRLRGALKEEEPVAVTSVQENEEEKEMLRDYFQLDVKLDELYKKWGETDPHFRRIANIFTGLCVFVHAEYNLLNRR